MAEKAKRKHIARRWIFVILIILIAGAFIIRQSGNNAPSRESIVIETIPFTGVEQTQAETADVALIRSDKENAKDITDDEVKSMVREAVALAGGLEDIVSDGDFVVLKPNMIAAKEVSGNMFSSMSDPDGYPEERLLNPRANGIATDFRVAQAVAELVRELNPNGQIYIMETSGWGNTAHNMEILGYTAENFPMVDQILNFDDIGSDPAKYAEELVAIDLGDKKVFEGGESLAHTNGLYFMDKVYYSADVVIDLPVLKNHSNAGFTGAVKNVAIGVAPIRIYGNQGMLELNRMAISHAWEPLNKWIHDFYLVKPADFVVTDGLQGSGYGPVAMGAPSLEEAQQNMRLILAGKDPLAVDTIHAYLVGTDPHRVDYMVLLGKENIGITDPAKINVLGNANVGDIKKKFGLPGFPMSLMSPGPAQAQYDDFTAPQITSENLEFSGNAIAGNITSDENLIKLDVFIDGKFADAIQGNGSNINISYSSEKLGSATTVFLRAYDGYLNSTIIHIK